MKQKLLKVLFICMAVAFLPRVAYAGGDIEINATNFPDDVFRNCLLGQDYGKDGILTENEIKNIKELCLNGKNISSLQGIEYFTALTSLDCYENQLTALDVSKNTALTRLGCSENQLTSLNVSGCTALTELYCYANQLTALDVSKNTALTYLFCYNNQLTALDVSKNTALFDFRCCNNQLTTLDVSSNTALEWLDCGNNQLSALDVSKNTALTRLSCSANQLSALDVSSNTALEWLHCYNNQLTVLDVSKNTALTDLSCFYNQLTVLDVLKNTVLWMLWCSDNQLTTLDVSSNTALEILYCYRNKIKGTSMDIFIKSLPVNNTDWSPSLYVYTPYSSDEGNVCTKEQVKAAKEKGWRVLYQSEDKGEWLEYEGSDDTPTNIDNIRTDAGKDAPIYNLRGQQLTAPQKGVNIIGGRKVVVK